MAYSSGILDHRVEIAQKMTATEGSFGRNSGGVKYQYLTTVWANVTFAKGTKALREGALDAYDTYMVRMRYRSDIDRDCILVWNDRCYTIDSLLVDYPNNQIQITATEKPDLQASDIEIFVDDEA